MSHWAETRRSIWNSESAIPCGGFELGEIENLVDHIEQLPPDF